MRARVQPAQIVEPPANRHSTVGVAIEMPASGKSVVTFTVPNNPALVGKRVFWQALDVDLANPAAARLTNVFEETFEQ